MKKRAISFLKPTINKFIVFIFLPFSIIVIAILIPGAGVILIPFLELYVKLGMPLFFIFGAIFGTIGVIFVLICLAVIWYLISCGLISLWRWARFRRQ